MGRLSAGDDDLEFLFLVTSELRCSLPPDETFL